MFSLGEKKETTNPAVLLEGEQGTFRVTSPAGDVARFECLPGHSIASIEHLGVTEPRSSYLIEKIADDVGMGLVQTTLTPRKRGAAGQV